MELDMHIRIKVPESTLTRNEARPSDPRSTHRGDDIERHFPPPDTFLGGGKALDIAVPENPPEHLLLKVVMTFTDAPVRLDVVGTDVSAEGKTVPEAFRSLIAAARSYVASTEGEEANLSRYEPYTWFRFVPPDPTALVDNAALIDGFISALNQLYEFKGDSVESFLEENVSLGGLLFEAHKVIRDHFGPDAEMALEVVADPEAPEDQELFVVIRPKLPPKRARALLSELDQGWWRDVSPAAQGKMELAIE